MQILLVFQEENVCGEQIERIDIFFFSIIYKAVDRVY